MTVKKALVPAIIIGVVGLVFIVFMVITGINRSRQTRAAYDEYKRIAESSLDGQQLVQILAAFSADNSEMIEPKVDLGSYYFSVGDYEKAGLYLSSAELLAAKSKNSEYTYLLYCNLAELRYQQGKYPEAIDYSKRARKIQSKDERGVMLVEANAQAAGDNIDTAIKLYSNYIEERKTFARPEDHRRYIVLLQQSGKLSECLAELDAYIKEKGYFSGAGLIASSAYEKQGNVPLAIIYAFQDYEFMRGIAITPLEQMAANLTRLRSELERKGLLSDSAARAAIDGVEYLVNSDFAKAKQAFMSISGIESTALGQYVVLRAEVGSGKLSNDRLAVLIGLEPQFQTFVSYYFTVFDALDSGLPENRLRKQMCLERVLSLTEYEPSVRAAKLGLVRLAGLSDNLAGDILLPSEIVQIVYSFNLNPDARIFDRVFTSLELPRHSYQDACIELLRESMSNARVRHIFEERQRIATPALAQKLALITGVAK